MIDVTELGARERGEEVGEWQLKSRQDRIACQHIVRTKTRTLVGVS